MTRAGCEVSRVADADEVALEEEAAADEECDGATGADEAGGEGCAGAVGLDTFFGAVAPPACGRCNILHSSIVVVALFRPPNIHNSC